MTGPHDDAEVVDTPYARPGGLELLARIYRPRGDAATPRAAVVYVHGGAWARSDRTADAILCHALAASGRVVVALDFRQAPDHRFPAAVADVAAEQDVVQDREVGEQFDVLEGPGDAPGRDLVGPQAHDRLALPADVAFLRVVHLIEAVEDRRLPGAVRADDGEQLPGGDREAHAVEGGEAPEDEADAVDLEQRPFSGCVGHDSHRLRRL